jgi:mono/diheme cytochrome c family protein
MGVKTERLLTLGVILLGVILGVGCGGANVSTTAPAFPDPSAAARSAGSGVTVSGTPATSLGADSTASSSTIAEGRSIFAENCVRCHGQNGQGVNGPNLQQETDLSKVENQVTNGGTRMPAFGVRLSGVQINAVAQYVLSLSGN